MRTHSNHIFHEYEDTTVNRALLLNRTMLMPAFLIGVIAINGCGALVSSPPVVNDKGTTHGTITAPTATTRTIYSSDLRTMQPGWASGPICSFTAQGLQVNPQNNQAYICLAPIPAQMNMSISVVVQQVNGAPNHGYGIAFRHNDPKSYYFFAIDSGGRFRVDTVINDRSTTLIPFTANAAIVKGLGRSNTLLVIVQGQQATFLVNGTPVGQATLKTFGNGTIGLRGVSDGAVLFTQFSVKNIN